MEAALEAGADDIVTNDDGSLDVLTTPDAFGAVKDALSGAGLDPERSEVTMRPANNVCIGIDEAKQMLRLLDMLDDADDVQQVYSNADIADEILAELQ